MMTNVQTQPGSMANCVGKIRLLDGVTNPNVPMANHEAVKSDEEECFC